MNSSIAQRLIELNRQFYQTFGGEFSATRGRIQPGVRKILNEIVDKNERILDLGCGNGNFAFALAQSGFSGNYLGLDFSLPLLENAAPLADDPRFGFDAVDLTSFSVDSGQWAVDSTSAVKSPPPTTHSPLPTPRFSLVTCFATLHHIPSRALRLNLLGFVRQNLAPGGKFIHSNWQFLNSPKLTTRIQPWGAAGLSAVDVDAGDYLLDWRSGGHGLRYAHHFSEEELVSLAAETGFQVERSFFSDGESGNLGLYQVWEGR